MLECLLALINTRLIQRGFPCHHHLIVCGIALVLLHFGSTNPCRITRNVEQTKMYVCTLKNIYSSRYLDALLYKLELN